MPAAGELTPGADAARAYAPLGAAARWLGWLNAIGALVEVAFSLGVLGADVAPPDLGLPLAVFLVGVVACGAAMLCWGLAQAGMSAARPPRRCMAVAVWLGALAYIVSLAAFAAGCWLSVGVAFDSSGDSMGTAYTVHATKF